MAWQSTPVQVDGKGNEWVFPLRYYDSNTKLAFFASNDEQTLYLTFSSGDNSVSRKVLMSGLKIEIDTGKGRKFPMAIVCKGMGSPNQMKQERGGRPSFMEGPPDSSRKQEFIRSIPIDITTHGLRNIPDGNYRSPNPYKLEAAIVPRDEAGRFFAEVAIPFALLYKNKITELDANLAFTIRVTLEKSDTPQMNGDRPSFSMGGGPGGGMGGPPSGGGGGGGMGGGPGGGMGGGPPGGGDFSSMNAGSETKTSFIVKLKPSLSQEN